MRPLAVELPGAWVEEQVCMVFADVAESTRHVALGGTEAATRLRALVDAAQAMVPAQGGGRVVERQGDGLLLAFREPRAAMACADRLHRLAQTAAAEAPAWPMRWRIGMHFDRVLADRRAYYGLGVSIAARIADLAQPGQTLLSAEVRDQLAPELAMAPADGFTDLGECWLKHVDEPVRLFRRDAAPAPPLPVDLQQALAARMRLRPTLVILPPEPGGAADRPLADVVLDQCCRRFSHSSVLHVISGWSCLALRGAEVAWSEIYRHWHADYLLQSQVRADAADPARIALVATLWRRGSGEPICRVERQGPVADLLASHGELIGEVVHLVGERILAVEQRQAAARVALPNLASHTLYLNAVDLLHRVSRTSFDRAHALLQALAERAPRHPDPLAWLARWHVFKVMQGWSDDSARDGQRALEFSERALACDPGSSLALTMAGSVLAGIRRDPAAAQRYYEQALAVNPNESLAWLMSGVAQGFLAAGDSALAASETALGLAPADPIRHFYDSLAATAALRAGAHDRCIALARRAIRSNATHGSSHRALAIALVMTGQLDEARETVAQLLAIEPECSVALYLARVGPMSETSLRFAAALREAGLPEH